MQQNFTQIIQYETSANKEEQPRQSSKRVYYPPPPEAAPYLHPSPTPEAAASVSPPGCVVRNLNSCFDSPEVATYASSYEAATNYAETTYCGPLVIAETDSESSNTDTDSFSELLLQHDWVEKISDVLYGCQY